MSIAVNIVTTSNIARRFTQTDDASIKEILENLRRSGQLFSNRNLIILKTAVELFGSVRTWQFGEVGGAA